MGNVSNVLNTTTDIFYVEVIGDATGRVAQIDELPLIENQLFLSFHFRDINRAAVNQYDIRGMNGSYGDNFTILDVSKADETRLSLDYSLSERRYNFYFSKSSGDYRLDRILDSAGNEITVFPLPYESESNSEIIGFSLDFTDDYLDPRNGLRFGITFSDKPAKGDINVADYYILNYNFLFYKQTHESDTLVFNYFQSDAHVRRQGNTDPNYHRAQLGLDCLGDPLCLQTEQELVNSLVNEATYGSASSLGGLERLRSYPQNRYSGGHSAFFGAEYRWNITDEATPFNYLFWKDVRTGKQIAFFAEAGTVSETSSELWDEQRYTYGVGFRLLAASGSVYRADLATGDEGTEIAVFFYYPWR